jgi:hypothetical protein
VLRMDVNAWQEGFDAGFSGQRLSSCQHHVGSVQAWSWSSGYIEGKAKRGELYMVPGQLSVWPLRNGKSGK